MAYIGKSPGTGIRNRFIYTATAGQTSFSGLDDQNRTLSYADAEFVDVFLNGVKLDKSDYTATSGTSIVLSEGAAVDDILEVLAFDVFSVFSGEFNGNVTVGSDLTVDTDTLYVDSTNDRVGIGTSSPDRLLTLQGNNSYMWIKDAGGGNTAFIGSDGTNDGWLRLYDSSHNTKVEIESDGVTYFNGGNVGIGTSSPSSKTSIIGTGVNGLHLGQQTDNNGNSARLFYDNSTNIWTTYSTAGSFKIASGATIGTTSGTDRLVINSSGNIGIGTSSPTANLHVSGSGARKIDITDTGGANTRISTANNNSYVGSTTNHPLLFITNDTERMRIDSSGNLLVGRTSVGNTGNGHSIRGGDSAIFSRNSSGETMQVCRNNSTGDLIRFLRNGTICGEIVNTGATTVNYNTSSDYRLKENVAAITDGITRVKQLQPKRFNFIAEAGRTVDGFIAHEAQSVVPEAVTGTHNGTEAIGDITDADNNTVETGVVEPDTLEDGHTWTETGTQPVYQGIDQAKLVPLLTAALQEAIAKIEALETQNADFETRIAALEAN